MCLVVEIVMLIAGLYAIIAGKVKLTKKIVLEGWQARVAGLFLAVPLPLALVSGFLIGFLIGMGSVPSSSQWVVTVVEFLLVLAGLAGAVIFGLVVGPKESEDSSGEEPPAAEV